MLVDPAVDGAVRGTLVRMGWSEQDLGDGLQEVRLRAVRAFARGLKPPETVAGMRALCVRIASNYTISLGRKEAVAEKHGDAGLCEDPDEHVPLVAVYEQRDPVDAARQLELAADLFRQGRMPEHGVDILEGVAAGCTYGEIGEDVGLTERAVEGRLRTMRRVFLAKIRERGMG
jgi:DNA-directed RNA polymerase specialized sigma24 family protein